MAVEPTDTASEGLFAEDDWARRVAYDLVRETAEADDVVQELWLKVLEKKPGGVESPRAWIRGAVRNIALMKRRSGVRRRKYEDGAAVRSEESIDPTEKTEAHDLVKWALEQLRPPYRETVELRYLQGFETIEIAERLGVPSDTIRARLARGLEHMRAALEKKSGKGAAGWPMLLLPLLRGRSPATNKRRAALSLRTVGVSAVEAMFGGKRKVVAGVAAVACILLFMFYPRTFESSPKANRTGTPRDGDGTGIMNSAMPSVVADRGTSVQRGPAAASGGTGAIPPAPTFTLSYEVQIIDGGAAVDAAVIVEAARWGAFSFALGPRRPLRLTPEESMPFEPVARVQGRSGHKMSIPVPEGGTYRLRISTEIAQNAVYATLCPEIEGTSVINLVRDPRISVFGISETTPVTIRRDERTTEPSIAMQSDDGEDEEFRRAKGPYLLPIRIDVGLDGIPGKATTRIQSREATVRLPPMFPYQCAVSSAFDDRPIAEVSSRSVVFGSDGTQWSIELKPSDAGTATIVLPQPNDRLTASFAQLRAPGFAMIDMRAPISAKILLDQTPTSEKNLPIVVRMLPENKNGGGRILDADGNAVKQGTVFYLTGETSPLVGALDSDGRFRFEPIMNSRIGHTSTFEYRAEPLFKEGTISLLFDDEDSRMNHFSDVPVDEILRGEWIGRLPRAEARSIEFIDKSTRDTVHPEDLDILPLDKDRRTLGWGIFKNFVSRRWPMDGMWVVRARSSRHEPLVVEIDAGRPVPPIELSPRKSKSIEIDVRLDGLPRPFQAFSFYDSRGIKLGQGVQQSDSRGRFVIVTADLGRTCTYRIEGSDVLPSIYAPTTLEVDGRYTIELKRAVAVPISVVDDKDRTIDAAAVVVRRPDGALGRGDTPLVENGKILLTNEPQQLIVTAPGFRPQPISWTPGPRGEIAPLRVVLTEGDTVRFRLDSKVGLDVKILVTILIRESFDVGTPTPIPPLWQIRLRPIIDDPNGHEFRAAPGRYELFVYSGDVVFVNKTFDVRGDTDLGTFVIER